MSADDLTSSFEDRLLRARKETVKRFASTQEVPRYGDIRPPRWGRLYEQHFPDDTDPFSRHVKLISQRLRHKRSPMRQAFLTAGYDPDNMAQSMETTVKNLWRTRRALRKAKQ
jgi:hypothetical protein